MPVRERIGRFKYTPEDRLEQEYEDTGKDLNEQIANLKGKED